MKLYSTCIQKDLTEKGTHVHNTLMIFDRENVTTLLTINVTDYIAPLLTIYKYKRMNQDITKAAPAYWILDKTNNGGCLEKIFFNTLVIYFTLI